VTQTKSREEFRLRPCPPRVWRAEASKLREEKKKGNRETRHTGILAG